MLLDGVSIKGSHEENQDSFLCDMLDHGFAIALSDGLGSKKDSKVGSKAACASVIELAKELGAKLTEIEPKEFAHLAHSRWLKKLRGHDIAECCATLLFFILYEGRVLAARLGDGFMGFWVDGSQEILFDAKEDRYANETDCLTENFNAEKISFFDANVIELHGAVICSDGIEFDEMSEAELGRFTKHFVESFRGMQNAEVKASIADWLQDWPGSDDKTLAFYISEWGGSDGSAN